MDTQVTKYIEKQQSPQKEILQKVRKIFQKTLRNCEEKWLGGYLLIQKENSTLQQ